MLGHGEAPAGFVLAGVMVRQRIETAPGHPLLPGEVISPEAFLAIPFGTRRALLGNDRLTPFYQPADKPAPAAASAVDRQRFAIHRGNGRYDVVEGALLNSEPLTREAAEALVASGSAVAQ
jgi:hypothetical protein